MKIFECAFPVEGERRQFRFDGQIERIPLHLPEKEKVTMEFKDVKILEFINGSYEAFEVINKSWTGRQLDEDDAFADVLSRYSRNMSGFEALYVHDVLREVLEKLETGDIVLENGRKVPKEVINGFFIGSSGSFDVLGLLLVTDKYTYYAVDENDAIMLDTATGELVSDNYFASVGFFDSLEAIKTGEEKLIYAAEGVLEE